MKIKKGQEASWEKDKIANKNYPELIQYIEDWTSKMEQEIDNHKDKEVREVLLNCANRYEHECDTCGLSGAMFGILLMRVEKIWEYGDILATLYDECFFVGNGEHKLEKQREKMEKEGKIEK